MILKFPESLTIKINGLFSVVNKIHKLKVNLKIFLRSERVQAIQY